VTPPSATLEGAGASVAVPESPAVSYPPQPFFGATGKFLLAIAVSIAVTVVSSALYFFIMDRLSGPVPEPSAPLDQKVASSTAEDDVPDGQAVANASTAEACVFGPLDTTTEYDVEVVKNAKDIALRNADRTLNYDDLVAIEEAGLVEAKQRAAVSRTLIDAIGRDRLKRIVDRYCDGDIGTLAPLDTDYERAMKDALATDPRVTACTLDSTDGATVPPIDLTYLASKILPADFDLGMDLYECSAKTYHEPVAAVRLAEIADQGINAGTVAGISSRESERDVRTSYYWLSAFRHIVKKYGFGFLESQSEFADTIEEIEYSVQFFGKHTSDELRAIEDTAVRDIERSPVTTTPTISDHEAAMAERVSMPTTKNSGVYIDDRYGISFPYPKEWRIEAYRVDSDRYVDITERAPGLAANDASLARIRVIVEGTMLDLPEVVNRAHRARKGLDWDVTQETSDAKIGTLPATYARYEYKAKEYGGHIGLEYIASGKFGLLYRFILDGDAAAVERSKALFDDMVANVVIYDASLGALSDTYRASKRVAETGKFYSPMSSFAVTYHPEYQVESYSTVNRTTGGALEGGVAIVLEDDTVDDRDPPFPAMMFIAYNAYAPDATTKSAAARFADDLKDVDELDTVSVTKGTAFVGGEEAATFSYLFKEPWNTETIKRVHYVLYKDGFEYQITIAGTPRSWEVHKAKVDAFLASVKFTDTFSQRYSDGMYSEDFGPWDRVLH
jgi:hypothetical protein